METIGLILPISFGVMLVLTGVLLLFNPERVLEWRSRNVELMEITRKGIIKGGVIILLTGLLLLALVFFIIFVLEPIRINKEREIEAQIERALERELESSFEKIRKELEEED